MHCRTAKKKLKRTTGNEAVDGFVFSNNCAKSYDRVCPLVNGRHREMHALQNELILAWLSANGIQSPLILDLGAGTCSDIVFLLKQQPRATGIALDAAPDMLALGKQKAARSGVLSRLSFIETTVDSLPSPDFLFRGRRPYHPHVIICSMLLHHFSTRIKKGVYEQIRRLFATKGLLVISDLFDFQNSFISDWALKRELSGIRRRFDSRALGVNSKAEWLTSASLSSLWLRHYQECNHPTAFEVEADIVRRSGFRTVECLYRLGQLGIIFIEP